MPKDTGTEHGNSLPYLDKLCKALQDLSELELTKGFVMPLLKTWGYPVVDYYGGPYEEGKDVIAWQEDELGDVALAVAQVKKFRLSAKSSSSRNLSEVLTQLSQAAENAVPNQNGQQYLPSTIYFITPFPIDTRSLQSRIHKVEDLRSKNIKIVDGPKLAAQVHQRLPNMASDLCGPEPHFERAIACQLSNHVLVQALQFAQPRAVETIYTDIDFLMGRPTTRPLLDTVFTPERLHLELEEAEWTSLREVAEELSDRLSVSILDLDADVVQARYARDRKRYDASGPLREQLDIEAREARVRQKQIRESRTDVINRATTPGSDTRAAAYELFDFQIREYETDDQVDKAFQERLTEITTLEKKLQAAPDIPTREVSQIVQLAHESADCNKGIEQIESRQRKLDDLRRPTWNVQLRTEDLAQLIVNERETLARQISAFNQRPPDSGTLTHFLASTQERMTTLGRALSNLHILKSLGGDRSLKFRSNGTRYRLAIPIRRVFETGLNVLVLGDAGAGKTTSLQAHAHGMLTSGDPDTFCIFAPLTRVVSRATGDGKPETREAEVAFLVQGICDYVNTLGTALTVAALQRVFAEPGCVVLLDGLDEVMKTAPWICHAIAHFSAEYASTVQVITSSRPFDDHLDILPFVGVTLLPFTDSQRDGFVESWFRECKIDYASTVRSHLATNLELAEVVRNPLLATILCVLAEKGVPLPNSELRLYDQRVKLLVGEYDVHKEAFRLASDRELLGRLARVIAFQLHNAQKRSASRRELLEQAHVILECCPDEAVRELALRELIQPCTILVPMTSDGKYGFGHLRYQEHLAARELAQNRALPILNLLREEWWRGALVMFAKMYEGSLVGMVRGLIERDLLEGRLAIVRAMAEVRPPSEQQVLERMLRTDELSLEERLRHVPVDMSYELLDGA